MSNQTSSQAPSNSAPVAALLRPPQHRDAAGELHDADDRTDIRHITGEELEMQVQREIQAAEKKKLPVIETGEFLVVEPDGSEDPWSSIDDGLLPSSDAEQERGERKEPER
jgi:hypothetical protein